MTVFRPVAGIVTAIAAGLATNLFGSARAGANGAALAGVAQRGAGLVDSERSRNVDDHVNEHAHGHDHGHAHDAPATQTDADGSARPGGSAIEAASRIVRYSFELLDDIAWWLVLGIVLSAVAEVAVPTDLLQGDWGAAQPRCC